VQRSQSGAEQRITRLPRVASFQSQSRFEVEPHLIQGFGRRPAILTCATTPPGKTMRAQ